MEKMIRVINDNLRNVINGIKEHKTDLENSLDNIRNEMAQKVKEANIYKTEVENARSIVYSLENEIADLENDLQELNVKFGSKDFKEMLSAGNKEINAKIIEKKALINEQGKIILDLTDKARSLKDALVELRERKIVTEDNLNKTKILESYFETRINEVIKYSEENPDELASYREEVPQDELIIQEDIDITSVIDGSIFEEIDEISNGEPDQELLKTVLANPQEIPVYETEEVEEPEEIEVSATNELEDMISEATSFVENKSSLLNNEEETEVVEEVEEEPVIEETPVIEENEVEEIPVDFEPTEILKEEVDEPLEKEVIDEIIAEEIVSEDNLSLESIEDSIKDIFVEETPEIVFENEDKPIEPEIISDDELLDNNDYIDISIADDALDATASFETPIVEEEDPFIDIKGLEDELGIDDVIDISVDDENLEISSNTNNDISNVDINIELTNVGLDPYKFNKDDLASLGETYNKYNVEEFINVIKKHNLDVEIVYDAASVLVNVQPQVLDRLLSLVSKTDAEKEDIALVFKYFDKVNVDRLEQVILSSNELSLTSSLSQSIEESDNDVISGVLGLSKKAEDLLRKNATIEELRIMNTLPDMVLENYREVRALNVDNLEDCISKFPHRFTITHSKFHEILDKYDTEDLIRCINKNPAVIDKL